MEQTESPLSSDSAHTPLLDEHISCEITAPINIEIGENVDMIEEQLDYEEFIEVKNNEEARAESEAEEGEYTSGDDNDIVICEVEDKQLLENGELQILDENSNDDKKCAVVKSLSKHGTDNEVSDENVVLKDDVKCDGELAEGELKAEEEEVIIEETPWERGLRLARERRELAKLKKVQEKDNLRDRQLHINLDNIEEVEPISKPQTEKNHEVNHKLLKALQPIVILPEEPRPNEMLLEYYLAELDYQHRPRFIPSRLYTLDPWEVEEWKRELDMMKMESEMERIASSKRKRVLDSKSLKGRRQGSMSSSGSSRSSSPSVGKGIFNQSNRTYEFQTSQYALSRNKPNLMNKSDKPFMDDSMRKSNVHHGQRDLPPEFKNRILSSSRSSSRSSSGSHSSSSGSSSSSRSTSSPRELIKKRGTAVLPSSLDQKRHGLSTNQPAYRTIKKPALGRGRSDSSYSSRSSDSSSSSSNGTSSQSSDSSDDSRKGRKSKNDKEFIKSWFTKTPQNQLEATIVSESTLPSSTTEKDEVNGSQNHSSNLYDGTGASSALVMGPDNNDCELPSASTRPGVKLKLVTRPKPIILPNQTTKSTSKNMSSEKTHKKTDVSSTTSASNTTSTGITTTKSNTAHSSIFQNNKSIFSTSSISSAANKSSEISQTAKESALKSNLAATKLEMQQEFLRNYKDKIAIYRSQLSYQQQNPISGQHPGTLIHTQPPPIKGPITVMSVTSKKTGPPKTHVKVTDRYSQHEEHSHRHNHHHSNYRNDFRDNVNSSSNSNRNKYESNRNRSRSFENDRRGESGDWRVDRPQGGNYDRDRNYFGEKTGMFSRDYDNKFRQSSDNFRAPRNSNAHDYNDKLRDNNYRSSFNDGGGNKFRELQHDKYGRGGDRGRFEGSDRDRDRGRNDFERSNRSDRGMDDRNRRDDRSNRNQRDFNRNKDQEQEQYVRKDRPRDRFRESDREFDNRFSDNVTKRSEIDSRDHSFESSKPLLPSRNSRNLDRDNIDSTSSTTNHAIEEVSVPKPALIPAAVVPKEKRREELLKQLKAVEDAIAKKKAKIDK